MTVASSTKPVAGLNIAHEIAEMLAGLASKSATARRLGVQADDINTILSDVALDQAAFIPVDADRDLNVRFVDAGRMPFIHPTFDETIDEIGPKANRGFWLPAHSVLVKKANCQPPPHFVIAHVGRCGSTLLSNLVALHPGCVVLREPEVLNRVLARLGSIRQNDARAKILLAADRIVRLLTSGTARDANGRRRLAAVKLTSWNLLLLSPLAQRWPKTRFVVLTREPTASIASFLARAPHWDAQFDRDDETEVQRATHHALAWRAMVEEALTLPTQRTHFVDYDTLVKEPRKVLDRLFAHCGITTPDDPLKEVQATMGRYSKMQAEVFDPSGQHNRPPLSPELLAKVRTITSSTQERLLSRFREQRVCGQSTEPQAVHRDR